MDRENGKKIWKQLYDAAITRGYNLDSRSGLIRPESSLKMIEALEIILKNSGFEGSEAEICEVLDFSVPNLVNSWTGAATEAQRAWDRFLRKNGGTFKGFTPVPPVPVPTPVPTPVPPAPKIVIPQPVDPEYVKPAEWDIFMRTIIMGIMDGKPIPIMLYGEAGIGKTEMAIQAAKAIASEFDPEFSDEVSAITAPVMASDVRGFVNAVGETVPTGFTRGYVKKGITLIEEIDRSEPPALICINMALANQKMDLPGAGMIKQNPLCVIVATANTPGIGATDEYNTANQLDRSTRDRFIFIEMKFDEVLATKLAKGDKSLVAFVRKWNEACELSNLGQNTASYRAISRIVRVIEKAGYTVKEALENVILRGGMSKDNIRSVIDKMGSMSGNMWFTNLTEIEKAMKDTY